MRDPLCSAFIAAGAAALLDILFRDAMRRGCNPLLFAWFNLAAGGAIVFVLAGMPAPRGLSLPVLLLLVVSAAAWAGQALVDLYAFQNLSASGNAILNAAGFMILNAAGFLLFKERAGPGAMLGLACIIAGILSGVRMRDPLELRGAKFRLFATLLGTFAVGVDKRLTQMITPELVVLLGYLAPAAALTCGRPKTLQQLPQELRNHGAIMAASAACYALVGYGLVLAIGYGQLWSAIALYQVRLVLVLPLAVLLLNEKDFLVRRAAGAALIMLGIALTRY